MTARSNDLRGLLLHRVSRRREPNDVLVINDLPISDSDPAAFDIRVRAANNGDQLIGDGPGGVLDDRIAGMNPAAAGSMPPIDGVDFSTLAPGPSEQVSVTINPSDESATIASWPPRRGTTTASPSTPRSPTTDRARFTTNGEASIRSD
ncbi:hypothetical protein DVR14_00495 (plasmid) [Natrinema thermotolerans]|nr:hypothetical protein DVR14_00495 [Natrinema thermotolerans]